ncbi:MAG: SCO family protein, partial [Methylococcaceae bacterium]|nr:SCO family protein [Methylococcaceae bacterium]
MNTKTIACGAVALLVVLLAGAAWGAETERNEGHEHHAMPQSSAPVTRTEADYQIPDVQVVREDGKKVSFKTELDDGRPVMVNFIYASCSAICPVLSHVFGKVQSKLGGEAKKIHMVSVSIDPENDTPAKLREYAAKFKAGPQWNHYTGTLEASIAIQKAFDAYRGDKMNHTPLTLMRGAPGKPWIRLDGFAGPDAVIKEYRAMTGG